jgi:hypothetical protein
MATTAAAGDKIGSSRLMSSGAARAIWLSGDGIARDKAAFDLDHTTGTHSDRRH